MSNKESCRHGMLSSHKRVCVPCRWSNWRNRLAKHLGSWRSPGNIKKRPGCQAWCCRIISYSALFLFGMGIFIPLVLSMFLAPSLLLPCSVDSLQYHWHNAGLHPLPFAFQHQPADCSSWSGCTSNLVPSWQQKVALHNEVWVFVCLFAYPGSKSLEPILCLRRVLDFWSFEQC